MCRDCKISSLKRKEDQSLDPKGNKSLHKRLVYKSKSVKVYKDRYLAAKRYLQQCIDMYIRGYKLRQVDSVLYSRLRRDSWSVTKYRRARAEAKKYGAI